MTDFETYLFNFLYHLEDLVPPPSGCHHVIGLSGDPTQGLRLAVQVNDKHQFYSYYLDAGDFDQDSHELARSVVALHQTRS
jgi:hypothetical protein